MRVKKIIGWVLIFMAVVLFTGILVEISSLKITMAAYGITALIVAFIILIVWLLESD